MRVTIFGVNRVKSRDFKGMSCSMAEVMEALGDRWGTIIMRDLLLGLTRYDDLQRSSGVTNATLSDRLKRLEQVGLIERRQYQSKPERHDYVPTGMGRDVALVMQAMVQTGDAWRRAEGREAPLRLVDAGSGRDLRLALVDAETGEPVYAPSIMIAPGPGADELMEWRLKRGEAERSTRRQASDRLP